MSSLHPTSWTLPVEVGLVELVATFPCLWKCKKDADFGLEENHAINTICSQLNIRFAKNFTESMVTKKWLELVLLFDIKYAMNGYKMDNRGTINNKDGSVKDDLTESWELFSMIGKFMANSEAGKRKTK